MWKGNENPSRSNETSSGSYRQVAALLAVRAHGARVDERPRRRRRHRNARARRLVVAAVDVHPHDVSAGGEGDGRKAGGKRIITLTLNVYFVGGRGSVGESMRGTHWLALRLYSTVGRSITRLGCRSACRMLASGGSTMPS